MAFIEFIESVGLVELSDYWVFALAEESTAPRPAVIQETNDSPNSKNTSNAITL